MNFTFILKSDQILTRKFTFFLANMFEQPFGQNYTDLKKKMIFNEFQSLSKIDCDQRKKL